MQKRMGAKACRQYILDHFQAHAIKGTINPSRTYEVVEQSATKLKIRSRDKSGRSVQTLFADLMTCKSLKYGEFRRVDLFWGMPRKPENATAAPSRSGGVFTDDGHHRGSIPGPTFLSNGELMPVDAFISRHSRKEKAS